MKKCVIFVIALLLLLAFVGCNSQGNINQSNNLSTENTVNNTTQTENNKIEPPDNFDIIPDKKLSEIPEKSSLDAVIDQTLVSIGVESVKYKEYGNFDNRDVASTIEVFIVTDTNKTLMTNAIFMNRSKKWDVMFISSVKDGKFYYIMPGTDMTDEVYDYTTDELVSKQSMPQEEFNEEAKNQEELDNNLNFIVIQSWADCISKNNFICSIDDDSVLVLLRTEGRTVDKMMEGFEKFSGMFPTILQSSEFESGIVTIVSDNNDVLFGWSFLPDGEVTSFLNSQFTNN